MGTEVCTNVWQMIIMTRNTAYRLYDNSRIFVTGMGREVYANVWQMIIMTRNTAIQTLWQLQNISNTSLRINKNDIKICWKEETS
jgi:hypothetical protein